MRRFRLVLLVIPLTAALASAGDLGSPIPLDKRIEAVEREQVEARAINAQQDRRLDALERQVKGTAKKDDGTITLAETGPVVVGSKASTFKLTPKAAPLVASGDVMVFRRVNGSLVQCDPETLEPVMTVVQSSTAFAAVGATGGVVMSADGSGCYTDANGNQVCPSSGSTSMSFQQSFNERPGLLRRVFGR